MDRTGQEVSISGIYRVLHEEHRLQREVTLIAGQSFPGCGRCWKPVRFELRKETPNLASRPYVIVRELSAIGSRRTEDWDDERAA